MVTKGNKNYKFCAQLNTQFQEMTTGNQGFWRKTGAISKITLQYKKN